MSLSLSDRTRHFFHVVSNIRPVVWIGLYVCLTPIFATIYWALPDGQFRIPDNAATDWGSWLYYSIVTITTLGFGDYTPALGWAQAITAIEVMCGLIFLGFFLNAVGSMKSEIDVASEIERQRRIHFNMEKDKIMKIIPAVLRSINVFLDFCYAISTPFSKRKGDDETYNPDFSFNDLYGLFSPSGLPTDHSSASVLTMLVSSGERASLSLDSLQSHVDLTLWPEILENCFAFVANFQMFSNSDTSLFTLANAKTETKRIQEEKISNQISQWKDDPVFPDDSELKPIEELYFFIKENAEIALKIESALSSILSEKDF